MKTISKVFRTPNYSYFLENNFDRYKNKLKTIMNFHLNIYTLMESKVIFPNVLN